MATGPGLVNRHYHPHQVFAYTISGKWGYLEHDWIATAGDWVYEAPGESHTLIAYECDEPMRVTFNVTGPLIWLDENGEPNGTFDVFDYIALVRDHYEKNGIGAVFRQIPTKVLSFEDFEKLDAPLPPVLKKFSMLHKGLVVVTGPTGSGKSTTLAAMVDYANKNRRDHIITVEDPIEFVHESKNCLINHREVGVHTKSFAAALRGALREDPDVILVGEMRDLETIELAITAASTGHLVFGTLHTQSASKTVDRIIDVFPSEQQNKIRATLSEALKGVVAQNLFRRVDKKGRCAALEVLVFTTAIANLVREGKTHQLPGMIQVGKKHGNQPLDDSIMDFLKMKRISPEEAYDKCLDKKKFRTFLSSPPLDDDNT